MEINEIIKDLVDILNREDGGNKELILRDAFNPIIKIMI